MWINTPDNMTDKDIHNETPTEGTTKTTDDNYSLLFPKFFTPIIEDKDGGKVITWNLKKGPKNITGWVYLESPKKGWRNKPIMPINQFSITHANLDKIHEFMDKYIMYDEESHQKIKQYFITESIRLTKDGGT